MDDEARPGKGTIIALAVLGVVAAIAFSVGDWFIPAYDGLTRAFGLEDNRWVGGDASLTLHLVGWGLLTFVVVLLATRPQTMFLLAVGVFAFGFLVEVAQTQLSSTRSFTSTDIFGNFLGCVIGLVGAVLLRAATRRRAVGKQEKPSP